MPALSCAALAWHCGAVALLAYLSPHTQHVPTKKSCAPGAIWAGSCCSRARFAPDEPLPVEPAAPVTHDAASGRRAAGRGTCGAAWGAEGREGWLWRCGAGWGVAGEGRQRLGEGDGEDEGERGGGWRWAGVSGAPFSSHARLPDGMILLAASAGRG